MKCLKTSVNDLRKIFEKAITIQYLAEILQSFDMQYSATSVKQYLEEKDFDIAGVKDNGKIIGFVEKKELENGRLEIYYKQFPEELLINASEPMLKGLNNLIEYPYLITYSENNEEYGIVTRGDLQKAPMRMWLFGLISIFEMHMLRIIQEICNEESDYTLYISQDRINKMNDEYKKQKENNASIDLATCTLFCDKRDIITKSGFYKRISNFKVGEFKRILNKIEKLRNILAHPQNINSKEWPEYIKLAATIEDLINNCEKIFIGNMK